MTKLITLFHIQWSGCTTDQKIEPFITLLPSCKP